jgi:hypothetical protein
MQNLTIFLIVLMFTSCASLNIPSDKSPLNEKYVALAKIYTDKLDDVWATRIEDEPKFTKDFANCRNEFEIAQFTKKYFSNEIDWCVEQIRNEWKYVLINHSFKFAEDKNMMLQGLDNVEQTFRKDTQRIHVLRHAYYKEQGIF